MNFILDIVILKTDLNKLNISEQFVEWGGEKSPQVPAKYTHKSGMVFHENVDNYYKKVLGNVDIEKYIALNLESSHLSELEFSVNHQELNEISNELIGFFDELYDTLEEFFVFLFRDEEEIDSQCVVKNQYELRNMFCNSLKWESPKGVLIAKKL